MKDNDIQMKNEKAVVALMDEMRDQKLAYFRELMKCRKKLKPFREQESLNPGAMALLEQIQKEINRMVEFLDEYEWMTSDEKNCFIQKIWKAIFLMFRQKRRVR